MQRGKARDKMSTLLDALSTGEYDLQTKRDVSSDFGRKLLVYRGEIVNAWSHDETQDLNQIIAALAKRDGLNEEQVKRIVEEVNNQINGILYQRQMNSPERNISATDFGIGGVADTNKIWDIVNGKVSKPDKAQEEKKADSEDLSAWMEKTASAPPVEEFYDMPETPMKESYGLYKKAAQSFMGRFKKLASEEEDLANNVLDDVETIGEAFVEYDKKGYDANRIFSQLAKQASLTTNQQSFLKTGVEHAIKVYKEEKKLPESYTLKLAYADPNEDEEFSLGEHSLTKIASIVDCPMIFVNGRYVNNFGTLLKIAQDVTSSVSELKNVQQSKKNMLEKCASSGVSFEQIEKAAEYGRSWVRQIVNHIEEG